MQRTSAIVMGALAAWLVLSPGVRAQEGDAWQSPTPQRVERFLEVFVPDLTPDAELGDYALAVQRLVTIQRAWERGDRLGAADLILAPTSPVDLAPLAEARQALQAARTMALWWDNQEARVMFGRYYNEVYLPDPKQAESQEAFATRFLQGASITDPKDPGRYLYTHLAHYGYSASNGLTPANYFFDLFDRYDRAMADAARLGLPQDQFALDLSLYRNAVIGRLVTQIEQARRFADNRLAPIESWSDVFSEAIKPIDVTPLDPPPDLETDLWEPPAGTEAILQVPSDATTPPPFFTPGNPTESQPADRVTEIAPAPKPDPLAGVDIFRLPSDQQPRPAASPVSGTPTSPVDTSTDPEITFETPGGGETAAMETPEADSAFVIIDELPAEPSESESADGEIDLFALPGGDPEVFSDAPVEEAVTVADGPDPALLAANREAGMVMREKALRHAQTVGGYAMELVLLWKSPDFESAEGKKQNERLTAQFVAEKDRLLASLYLLDIYGVHARLGMTEGALDASLLEALHADYNLRKDEGDETVVRLMVDIDNALAQLAEGVTERRTRDSVASAQQRAYDALKGGEFAAIARQLEETVLN
ncbi:MAG: hypothetical protein GEEBNDBF_01316 [bacterium]|nr:hypothetical protein [bacterium]